MITPLLILLIGLVGMLALVPVFGLLGRQQESRRDVRLRIGSAVVLGYLAGGIIVWWLLPPQWQLSFRETLAASVDANTYGHPIEHYAQGVIILILCAGLAGAAIGGGLTAIAARFSKRPHHA